MILAVAVSGFCAGAGQNHATITVTGGPVPVSILVSRVSLRNLDEGDFEPFIRVLLTVFAQSVSGELTQANLASLDGKAFEIDVSKLVTL